MELMTLIYCPTCKRLGVDDPEESYGFLCGRCLGRVEIFHLAADLPTVNRLLEAVNELVAEAYLTGREGGKPLEASA